VQSFVWEKEEAKDLISEVVLQALEGFNHLREHDKFLPYLFSIARNIYFKQLRSKKRGIASRLPEDETTLEHFATAPLEGKHYELSKLLLKLDDTERELICLFELSGFSYAEISAIVHISEAQVKAKLYQARQQLKAFVKQDNERYQNLLTNKEHSHGK
jgi:RNA polymerase sigma-70 factor (ECF subfamily)